MEKNLDHKGRWRNVTVSFRMSQEESDDLNRRVKLSGLNKQDYIIRRLTERVSAPMIKCKKTPIKKCRFMARRDSI